MHSETMAPSLQATQAAPFPTIAAIATGVGGGVGIIRVSGPLAEQVGRQLCDPLPESIQSHRLYLTNFHEWRPARLDASDASSVSVNSTPTRSTHSRGESIDQGLVCLMKAPNSYTGEDVLEVHAHGGAVNLNRILASIFSMGVSPAEPGEFTKRAFLAGKLDLTQAEAVAALVGSQSVQATRHARRQLSGEMGKDLSMVRKRILYFLGSIEGGLDFPDLGPEEDLSKENLAELVSIQSKLQHLASTFSNAGNVMSQGIEVLLLGRTNAGKSSLINALCGTERVLVDAEPGTTRDFVEVRTTFRDVSLTLIDTAGERLLATKLEQEGKRLAMRRGMHADLILLVVDGTAGFGNEEQKLLSEIPNQVPVLLVWNKMDGLGFTLPSVAENPFGPRMFPKEHIVSCSALCGWGLDTLKEAILQTLAPHFGEETVILNARQARLLSKASDRLYGAIQGIRLKTSMDVVAAELRLAALALGELTGEEVAESVVDEIFAQFCIGK